MMIQREILLPLVVVVIYCLSEAVVHSFLNPGLPKQRLGSFWMSETTRGDTFDEHQLTNDNKRIIFIRHGRTYMNEYLGDGGTSFGAPNFSDIFSVEDNERYLDSRLSNSGVEQAQKLAVQLKDLQQGTDSPELRLLNKDKYFLNEIDLIVVSPLTRAIQTMELALLPAFKSPTPPIIALPAAAERVFLISDIGKPRSLLQTTYGDKMDFESGFERDGELDEEWWFSLDDSKRQARAVPSGINKANYVEWRPTGENQQYARPGEPDEKFHERMVKLYCWLRDRPEQTITVICHFGVIEWMLDLRFKNCELRVVPFTEIKPVGLPRGEFVKCRMSERNESSS